MLLFVCCLGLVGVEVEAGGVEGAG